MRPAAHRDGLRMEGRIVRNPWMSLWLSAANKAAGTARGLWTAEAQRQQQAFAREVAKAWRVAPAKAGKAPKRGK